MQSRPCNAAAPQRVTRSVPRAALVALLLNLVRWPSQPTPLLRSLVSWLPAMRARVVVGPFAARHGVASSGRSTSYPASPLCAVWGTAPPASPATTLVESGAEAREQSRVAGFGVALEGETLERAASASFDGFDEGGQPDGPDAVASQVE